MSFIQKIYYLCFKKNKLCVGCCDRHQLDQTSTLAALLVLCVLRRVKDHHDVLHGSPTLKKTGVRKVALDKWCPPEIGEREREREIWKEFPSRTPVSKPVAARPSAARRKPWGRGARCRKRGAPFLLEGGRSPAPAFWMDLCA